MPVILASKRLRQEEPEFQARLGGEAQSRKEVFPFCLQQDSKTADTIQCELKSSTGRKFPHLQEGVWSGSGPTEKIMESDEVCTVYSHGTAFTDLGLDSILCLS